MKRLNPLYLLAFAIVLAAYAAFSVHKERLRLETLRNEYAAAKDLARKLRSIQNAYGVKKKVYLLRSLRANRSLYSKLKVKEKKKSLKIESAALPLKDANFLLAKVLNGTYALTALTFTKKDEEHIAVSLELKW